MSYNDNKYRVRPTYTATPARSEMRGLTRLEAVKLIARQLEEGNDAKIMDYHQRKMAPGQESALRQIASLWNELDRLEESVRSRK